MNIPRELFTQLHEMVYTQNCNLIRRICFDYGWNADKMIADLLDNTNHLPPNEFHTLDGILATPLSESEMEQQCEKNNTPIQNVALLQQFTPPELIRLEQTLCIREKEYHIYTLTEDVSGLLLLWKGKYCIWDLHAEIIYELHQGELRFLEKSTLPPEEMTSYIIEY